MDRKKIIHYSYLAFVALLAASIPVSRYMISVFQFCLAGIFILEGIRLESYLSFYRDHKLFYRILLSFPFHLWMILDAVARQLRLLARNKHFLVFMLFALVYLLGLIHTSNVHEAMKVLRNKLPILLLPMFFAAIRSITRAEKHMVLLFFVLSVSISSFISLSIFIGGNYDDLRRISPFISHIHLAIFISYAIFILLYYIRHLQLNTLQKFSALLCMFWLIIFQLLILKSLTGVIILFMGAYFILIFQRFFNFSIHKVLRLSLLVLLPLSITVFLLLSLIRFYDVDELNPDQLERFTEQGNPYLHEPDNRTLENGHYVYIYISEKEIREAWNKVSDYKYDSLDKKNQPLKYTLIRYLTSKGLRKDAQGVQQLSKDDINMVEEGFANHIYSRKLSLYPRIYQVLWELDVYFKFGNPTGHSVTQRLESLKMGTHIVKEYPLFGVGTGDLLDSYNKKYDQLESPVPYHRRITGANQFLNLVVKFGFIGFAFILFAWLWPAIRSKAFHDPLFTMFFVIALIAMFSEEILRFQTGITFFAFFYSFFVFTGDEQRAPYKVTHTTTKPSV